jgi:hypothetical protein
MVCCGQVNSAYPVAVSMRLVHAPAAFARPMVQRKLFRPSFKVNLSSRTPRRQRHDVAGRG